MADVTFTSDRTKGFRRLALLLTLVGVTASVSSFVAILDHGPGFWGVSALAGSILFLVVNASFLTVRHSAPWMFRLQAIVVFLIGLLSAVISPPDEYAGMLLAGVGVVMLAKTGVLFTTVHVLLVMTVTVLVDSAVGFVFQNGALLTTVAIAAVSLGSFGIVYYAFYVELRQAVRSVRFFRERSTVESRLAETLRDELEETTAAHERLNQQVVASSRRIHELSRRVRELEAANRPVDPDLFGVSHREHEVLRELVRTRAKNRELAERLGITERTVKAHIQNICNKIGVDTRWELIDLFRHNWPGPDR